MNTDVRPREPVLLDAAETAAYLSTSVRHLRRLVAEHGLPVRRLGGRLRWHRADLDAWLAEACPAEIRSDPRVRGAR